MLKLVSDQYLLIIKGKTIATLEKSDIPLLKQVIEVNITDNGIKRCHVPPE